MTKQKILLFLILVTALLLRFYQLGKIPLSLYWDEASLGYNAYSISQTLHDEHGEYLPIARFIAFGDYKPPGYIYFTAGAIKLFGLSEFSIRLTSAVAGVLLVLVTYFLVNELFGSSIVGLVSSLFLAISPWSLQFSRAAFEANLATLYSTGGIYFFIKGVKTKSFGYYLCSIVFLGLSMYTFNTHRIFVPLVLLALSIIYFRELLLQWKKITVIVILLTLAVLPMVHHLLSPEGRLRFQEVAWVNDVAPIELSNSRQNVDGNSILASIFHNRRIVYSQEFLKHYFDHFKPDYLFFSGDVNDRLSIQSFGEMYWLDLIFLLGGIYFLIKNRSKSSAVLLVWVGVGLIPAALARETPHALRTLNILPVPQIVSGLGAVAILNFVQRYRKAVILTFVMALSFILLFYLHDYYIHYPVAAEKTWQYGYKQAVEYVASVQDIYEGVSVTNEYGRPYIYFLLYNEYDPTKYWQNRRATSDSYGLWNVQGFDKYYFDNSEHPSGKWLYVRAPDETIAHGQLIKTIFDPVGNPIFKIYNNL